MSKWLFVKRFLKEGVYSHSHVCCSVSRQIDKLSFVISTHVSLFHLFVRVYLARSLKACLCHLFFIQSFKERHSLDLNGECLMLLLKEEPTFLTSITINLGFYNKL